MRLAAFDGQTLRPAPSEAAQKKLPNKLSSVILEIVLATPVQDVRTSTHRSLYLA